MANRQTTFLLKRSNVPGKIPPMSGLTIGELALNTADAILYTSGTTSNSILPIGWDRIHRTGDTVTGDFNFYGGLSAVTISATTFYGNGTNLTGVVKGSGTANYISRWTGTTGQGNSIIQDDGTNVGIGITPQTVYKVWLYTSGNFTALRVTNAILTGSCIGIQVDAEGGGGASTGLVANSKTSFMGTSVAVKGLGGDGLLSIGVYGEVGPNEDGFVGTGIGGYFNGRGDGSYGYPSASYSVQLQDGTEGINKVLVSQTADGKANWSSVLTGLTSVSATTISATNLYVTGGTQSIFSGSSSSELFRITQTGVGDAFVVEDSSNSDNSHFVINASGNTAIGLTQPIGDDKLTVSGNTTVYGTVSATTYAGGGVNNGKLLSITELTASTLATHTVPTGSLFTAINCNSDATNRYAKITFTAPSSGIVEIIFEADIVFVNSSAVQMVGLNTTTGSTTTPNQGWFRINGDADASSATYRAVFNIKSLTPGTSYTYYVMSVCNFSGNLVRCGSLQTGAYVSGADRPSPLRIYARDIGTTVITTNPSS
jgi:hypothetical protein